MTSLLLPQLKIQDVVTPYRKIALEASAGKIELIPGDVEKLAAEFPLLPSSIKDAAIKLFAMVTLRGTRNFNPRRFVVWPDADYSKGVHVFVKWAFEDDNTIGKLSVGKLEIQDASLPTRYFLVLLPHRYLIVNANANLRRAYMPKRVA